MTRNQSEIMGILGNLCKRGKARSMQEDELYRHMIDGLYSFGEVRPVEKAKQVVDEWRRLRSRSFDGCLSPPSTRTHVTNL